MGGSGTLALAASPTPQPAPAAPVLPLAPVLLLPQADTAPPGSDDELGADGASGLNPTASSWLLLPVVRCPRLRRDFTDSPRTLANSDRRYARRGPPEAWGVEVDMLNRPEAQAVSCARDQHATPPAHVEANTIQSRRPRHDARRSQMRSLPMGAQLSLAQTWLQEFVHTVVSCGPRDRKCANMRYCKIPIDARSTVLSTQRQHVRCGPPWTRARRQLVAAVRRWLKKALTTALQRKWGSQMGPS